MSAKSIVVALGLAALATFPETASAADMPAGHGPCKSVKFSCGGSEPFWNFELKKGKIRFFDAGNPNGATVPVVRSACAKPIGAGGYKVTSTGTLNLTATIKKKSCTDESSTHHAYTISISYRQGSLTSSSTQVSGPGCCSK